MRECKRCGKPFESINGMQAYCSPECYTEVNRERSRIKCNERIEKACECCGSIFTKTRYSKKIYCTNKCRKEMQKAMNVEKQKKVVCKSKSIAELQREAREHGMTYGQYVAQMEMKKG